MFFFVFMISIFPLSVQAQLDELIMGDFNSSLELQEYLNHFKVLEGRLIIKKDDSIKEDTEIKYKYQGKKKIDGTEVEQFNIELNSTKDSSLIEFYFNKTQLKELKVDGRRVDLEKRNEFAEELLKNLFGPYVLIENYRELNFQDIDNLEVNREDIAGKEINVLTLESKKLDKLAIKSAKFKLGSFDDLLLLTAYEYQSSNTGENYSFSLNNIEINQ